MRAKKTEHKGQSHITRAGSDRTGNRTSGAACSVPSHLEQTVPLKGRGGVCHWSGLLEVLQALSATLITPKKVGILPIPWPKRFYLGSTLISSISLLWMEVKVEICPVAAMAITCNSSVYQSKYLLKALLKCRNREDTFLPNIRDVSWYLLMT